MKKMPIDVSANILDNNTDPTVFNLFLPMLCKLGKNLVFKCLS